MPSRHVFAASAVVLLISPHASGADVPVSNASELTTAIGNAVAGDTILLASGTYALTGVTCSANGTESAPIVVRSETPLGAKIDMDALEGFNVTGANWHFEGLDVQGVCAQDSDCEHAFHVSGGAEGFVLRHSRVRDFNAQLKVNANTGGAQIPHRGTVEYCDIGDTAPRNTSNPVTKLNIDTGDDWVVRGNYIHDFHKSGGNNISYGAFMKSGGNDGVFERNLVACTAEVATGGVRIGLSFGGGGTAPQFCAPAFDANVPCDVEHDGGTLRNNIILSCSDVGIYLNRAANTQVLHNTLIDTTGIDFRFATTSGAARGNLLMSNIRDRDGASHVESDNLAGQDLSFFTTLYTDPLAFDLTVAGDATGLQTAGALPDVSDDYCARERPADNVAIGALEHSLGDCDVMPPPEGPTTGAGGAGMGGGAASGGAGVGGMGAGAGLGRAGGDPVENPVDDPEGDDDGGCSCALPGRSVPTGSWFALVLLGAAVLVRRSTLSR